MIALFVVIGSVLLTAALVSVWRKQNEPFYFDGIHETGWGPLAFVCLMECVSVTVILWMPVLAILALLWIACIGVGVFALGRQNVHDLGLSGRNVFLGAAYAAVWWAVVVGALSGVAYARRLPLQWPVFNGNIGPLVLQLLLFAPPEEIAFRGFLLPQLYLKFRKTCRHSGAALTMAILISQLAFTLMHIPHRMVEHIPPGEIATNLALTGASGILFALVYLRTQNLIAALTVHAVFNVSGLYPSALSWRMRQLIFVVAALIVADLYARLRRDKVKVAMASGAKAGLSAR
jgi:CAAX protease family protein